MGDPREDVSWTALLAGAFMEKSLHDRIVRDYEKVSGRILNNLDYFEVASAIRRLADMFTSFKDGAESRGMRPGAEEQMRAQIGHYRRIYIRMEELTGIDSPEIEAFLEA